MQNKKFLDFLYSETIERIAQVYFNHCDPPTELQIITRLKGIDVIQMHCCNNYNHLDFDTLYFIDYTQSLKSLQKKIIDFIGHDKKLTEEEQKKIELFIFEQFDDEYDFLSFKNIDYFVFYKE